MVDRRYSYSRECKWSGEAADMIQFHHIVARKNGVKGFVFCFSALLILANSLFLFPLKGKSIFVVLWSFVIEALLLKLLLWKAVKKESVLVMPALGIQLETHYVSGKVIRRFIPVNKILKPVLLEHVTPVTCYWTLCLVVCGEAELISVFERLWPPVKMLVPIWKALCAAVNEEESSNTSSENECLGEICGTSLSRGQHELSAPN